MANMKLTNPNKFITWDIENVKNVMLGLRSQNTTTKSFNVNGKATNCGYDPECGTEQSGRHLYDCTDPHARLTELDRYLPSLRSTVESLTNLIMSQRLVNQDPAQTARFNDFMQSMNIGGQSNYETLVHAIAEALIYGRCGLRFISPTSGFVMVPTTEYSIIYHEDTINKGIFVPDGYLLARPKTKSMGAYGEKYDISDTHLPDMPINFELDQLENDEYIYIKASTGKFYSLYFYGDLLNPDTPLNHDEGRIDMFMQLIENLVRSLELANNDIDMVKLRENLLNMQNVKASDLVATSKNAKDAKNDSVMKEILNFARTISNSTGRDTLVVPPTVDTFESLGSNIDVADFLKLYDYIESFIAKLYGLSSNVLTLESMPRDASANPIFEQMMKVSVYPKRRMVAICINNFIATNIGIKPVHFAEESYARGLKITNAQSLANVVATLANPELDVDLSQLVQDSIIKPLLEEGE